MREILFRGKRRDNGEWAYGSLIVVGSYCCILESEDKAHPAYYPYLDDYIGTIDGCATPVIPETVGQYTGFTDINGQKIFEGDLIRYKVHYEIGCYPHGENKTGPVIFSDGAFMPLVYCYSNGPVEIVGNIHDNPEMEKKAWEMR